MCIICKQALPPTDLQALDGVSICRAARWCLIQLLRDATPQQIADLQRKVTETALLATESTLRIREIPT